VKNLAGIVEITHELGSEIVRYYTIRLEEEPYNLFEQFINRHQGRDEIKEELNDLLGWLQIRMGRQRGALDRFFRHERNAHALPPYPRELSIQYKHNLRLYCLRISNEIVFLFN